jgi:flagellar biosynthesis protein FlhG
MIGQAERLIELSKLEPPDTGLPVNNLITFSSGKGGTGKTFLSLNIAYLLSSRNNKVLYLDLDMNFANSNIFLNIIPKATINHFFDRKKLFNEIIYEYNPNMHFIFGESGNLQSSDLTVENLKMLYSTLVSKSAIYDFIIVDTSAGGNKEQIKLLSLSKMNIIVTQPEPTAVMDAYVMIKLLNEIGYPGQNYIIVNRCINKSDGINAFENIRIASNHFLEKNVEPLGFLSDEIIVGTASKNQELLVEKYPEHPFSQKISSIAGTISDITQMANIQHN